MDAVRAERVDHEHVEYIPAGDVLVVADAREHPRVAHNGNRSSMPITTSTAPATITIEKVLKGKVGMRKKSTFLWNRSKVRRQHQTFGRNDRS